jgi:hypothetical protein
MTEAREALKSDDLERIKRAQEELTKASHKLAEAMYREAQNPPAEPSLDPTARRVRKVRRGM